jgi:hypothetical protein
MASRRIQPPRLDLAEVMENLKREASFIGGEGNQLFVKGFIR